MAAMIDNRRRRDRLIRIVRHLDTQDLNILTGIALNMAASNMAPARPRQAKAYDKFAPKKKLRPG